MFTSSRKAGRPRKVGVPRNEKGAIAYGHRSITESPEAITAQAEEARIRQLLGVDVWQAKKRDEKAMAAARKRIRNPLLGSALGRLLHGAEINRDQYDAGMWFAEVYRDWAIIRGLPSPNMKALDYGAIPGRSVAPEKNDDQVKAIRRRWEQAMKFIYNAHGDNGLTAGPIFEILKRTLVEDIGPLNADELGDLRVGLNAVNQARGA